MIAPAMEAGPLVALSDVQTVREHPPQAVVNFKSLAVSAR